jgi:hypothetical protein
VAAILVGVLKCRTQYWKRNTQESFQQSLVEIGSVFSENIFFYFQPTFFLICIFGQNRQKFKVHSQSQPNFAEMILGWSPFKIVSVSAVLFPRWAPLLKIEISSNGYMLKSSSLCLYSSNLDTFWLNIEQFWPFEEISIFSNGAHLGNRTARHY